MSYIYSEKLEDGTIVDHRIAGKPNVQMALPTRPGMVLFSDSENKIPEDIGYALHASEKNPNVEGSMASKIAENSEKLSENEDFLKSKNLYECDEVLNVSVTKGITLPAPIKAGKYIVSVESLSSTDTDASISVLRLYLEGGTEFNINLARQNSYQETIIELPKDAVYSDILSSDSFGHSSGDTSIWTKLMIRSADITDNTYKPFSKSNAVITQELSTLDAIKTNYVSKAVDFRNGIVRTSTPLSFNMPANCAYVLFAHRKTNSIAFIAMCDYWSSDVTNLIGGSSAITITKNANSGIINITTTIPQGTPIGILAFGMEN